MCHFLNEFFLVFLFLDVKNHEYFNGVDWNAIAERKSEFGPLPNVQAENFADSANSHEILFHSIESDQLSDDDCHKIRGNVQIKFANFL